jgi:hypothetical protein
MKAFLLTIAAFIAYSGAVSAQGSLPPDYYWEVGANFGYSELTRPAGPADLYVGNRTKPVGDYSLRLDYFTSPHWMLNLDIGSRQWQTTGNWALNGLYGQQLNPQEITFLLASHAVNESVGINYVIPFYTTYNTFNRANVYFGAMAGMITTVNDGSTGYSTYKSKTDSGETYVSHYDYGFGFGYNIGIQAGFTYYVIPRLGINLDLAMRYASVKTNDMDYRSENSIYHLLYFPETIGIRWRF